MIVLHCECGKTLEVPPDTPATTGICPSCRRVLPLPKRDDRPELRAALEGHHGVIRDLAFSPDERLLATVSANEQSGGGKPKPGETFLWHTGTGALATQLQGSAGAIFAVTFLPDGRHLVTSSKDHTLAVWDIVHGLHGVVMGVRVQTLRGHKHSVSSLAGAPDGRTLASVAQDQILLWDTSTWRQTALLCGRSLGVGRLAYSPNGSLLAGVWSSRGPVVAWNTTSHKEAFRLQLPRDEDGEDYGLSFSSDGRKLAVVSHDGIRVWDVSTCQVLVHLIARGLKTVCFAPDSRTLFAAGNDLPEHIYLRRWDAITGRRLEEFRGHKRPISCLALSAAGRLLASGSDDMTINLWELPPPTAVPTTIV